MVAQKTGKGDELLGRGLDSVKTQTTLSRNWSLYDTAKWRQVVRSLGSTWPGASTIISKCSCNLRYEPPLLPPIEIEVVV